MFNRALLSALCAALVLVRIVDARDPDAPPARVTPVTDTYHGVQRCFALRCRPLAFTTC